jgi:tetraacyldisaccharide 4'-kinase
MTLTHTLLHSLDGRRSAALEGLRGQTVHAIAGIGNPERFFELLRRNGLTARPHAFPDHHGFRPDDVRFEDGYPVLMTEKDAVKCRRMPCENCWVVRVDAQPDAAFVHRLEGALNEITDGQDPSHSRAQDQ